MKLTKPIIKLICALEEEIGNECFNPNSYNGWTDEEGLSYRYPVYVCTDKTRRTEENSNITHLTP